MANKKSQSGLRVGQTMTYRGESVTIKAFPNAFTALITPNPFRGGKWITKTVALVDLVP
jgi:hypothetical protein